MCFGRKIATEINHFSEDPFIHDIDVLIMNEGEYNKMEDINK